MPFFICPNCKTRSIDADGRQGLSHQPVACARCGFGFLFELIDDYYPSPSAGLVVCDERRTDSRSGPRRLRADGLPGERPDGEGRRRGVRARGLRAKANPAALALEWGVRRLGERLTCAPARASDKAVVADFFPGYDDDGGLLVALSPRRASSRRSDQPTTLFVASLFPFTSTARQVSDTPDATVTGARRTASNRRRRADLDSGDPGVVGRCKRHERSRRRGRSRREGARRCDVAEVEGRAPADAGEFRLARH